MKTRKSKNPHIGPMQQSLASCAVLAASGVLLCTAALAQSSRIPVGALPSGPATQALVGGSASIRQPQIVAGSFNPYQVNGNTATITQTNNAGILRWGSFDIGLGATVNVVQPNATSVLLNKVDGGAFLNKTVIEGMLNGNGQVYIYNPNGIIFGKTSSVNVNSLVATTLKIDDSRFLAGLIAPNTAPVFAADPTFKPDGINLGLPGSIVVEGESANTQAQINAARGGKILLIAPNISNAGKLSAPDGQVLTAAGNKVYLAAPDSVQMRGLLVEVGTGGTVTNESIGKILVERGNASLVGFAVNQNGTISATTTVQANGSIYLRAQDGANKDSAQDILRPTRGGTLTLGANSITQVLPDLADKTVAPKSSYNASQINLFGQSVHLEQNAQVVAPGGDVKVLAQVDPRTRSTSGITGGTIGSNGVFVENGAVIDVSGTTNTELAMESNVISVELRGTELADVPLQRNSILRGQKVNIDRRKGTPLANVQGYLDLIEYGIGENTANGGTVTFSADQEVVLADGAKVDVSGGMVTYRSGYVATTQLQSGRFSVDIGSATSDRIYTGFTNTAPGPRNFEAGYSEGRSAGSVRFDASTLLLRGDLLGKITPGARQRDVSTSSFPKGGELIIGGTSRIESSLLASSYSNFSFFGSINFGGTTTTGIATPTFGAAWDAANADQQILRSTLDLDPALLAAGGFTRINTYTRNDVPHGITGAVVVSKDVDIKPGGEFRVAAEDSVALDADITIPGGTVEAISATAQLSVASNVKVNVAGQWTNDRSTPAPALDALGNPTAAIVTQGGSILLSGKGSVTNSVAVDIGDGASFDASGGAWQNTAGKTASGSGGAITITASPVDASAPQSAGLLLGHGIDFKSYGVSKGGTLKLSGRNVVLGTDLSADPLDLAFGSLFFTRGGFSRYDITAAGNLTVAQGATIAPRMDNWVINRNTPTRSGGTMATAFDVGTLPLGGAQGSRGATSLSLSAGAKLGNDAGRLWFQQGSSIVTDPGATVSLSAGRQLTVDGRISNPSGNVNLLLTADPADAALAYRPERSVWIGATAQVDVSGTTSRLWTNSNGITQGDLFGGGNINIGRLAGTDLVSAAGFVAVEKGAVLDVSGELASMTLSGGRSGVTTRQVASAAGSIDIRSRESMLIEGELRGKGGDTTVAGGSIALTLDREGATGTTDSSVADRELVVLKQKLNAGTANESIVPPGLAADQPLDANYAGNAYVLASTLSNSGFDRVRLKSQDKITFDAATGNVGLSARSDVTLDAPVISAVNTTGASRVTVAAAHVGIGNSDWRYQAAGSAALPSAGNGASFEINATTVDVVGSSVLQGIANANFYASEDIRFAGVVASDLSLAPLVTLPVLHAYGNLKSANRMSFTARQVYPTTMSGFALNAIGAGSQIEFHRNGSSANAPLSAAGTLTVNAENIVQDGVVRAPFGSIALTATETLSYGANSLTSVAGSDTVPLGRTSNGRDWLYDFGNGHTVTLGNTGVSNGVALPDKKITSTAKNIDVATGAVIDLSGGGDLYAYEFTAGPGGSRDVLAALRDKDNKLLPATVFAILPGYDSSFAPLDFQYQQDGGLQAGDRVYLSGIPGLAAGFYTLLPAHYALLPGAYSVSAASGTRDMSATGNFAKTDGTWVVSGYRGTTVAGDSRSSGFFVTSTAQVRTQSQFTDHSANTFFTSLPTPLPNSGGHVAFAASETISLDGLIKLGAAPGVAGGKRGIADISAPDIAVVADASQNTGTAVKLLAADLAELGADSLLLGGLRDVQSDGTHVAVGANKVTVSNDAAHPLSGPEVILAARDEVRVVSGSVVSSSGAPTTKSGALILEGSGLDADGALLRVSGGEQVAIVRNAPPGIKGTLTIENGAAASAVGSMNLDATKSLANASQLGLGSNTALGLGANRISFGDGIPGAISGLKFDSAALIDLGRLAGLSLTSYTTFDVYGNVNLGSAATRSLSLRGAGMQAYANSGATVVLTADTVRFDGGGTYTLASPAPAAAGSLSVNARDIEIGSNAFAIKGYSNTNLTAQREVRAAGKGGQLSTDGNMTAAAGRITATSGAEGGLKAGGVLSLAGVAMPQAALTTDALGGKVNFEGNTITSSANVVARSGKVTFKSEQGVQITGGEINASGYSKAFGSTVAYAPGGSIELNSGNGNVSVNSAATLDVSAIGADAGLITANATNGSNGTVSLDGTLKGSAVAGVDGLAHEQGRFKLDADQILQFGALNQKLNSGGFTEARELRIRRDNVSLAASESIVAHDVLITADNGNITVGGSINADGAKGGSIQLYAGQAGNSGGSGNVTLLGTAVLSAKATQAASSGAGSAGDGGRVVIGTSTADGSMVASTSGNSSIDLQSGATIDVSGSGQGQGGTVTLRAPRVGSDAGSDIAIASLDAIPTGSRETVIEGFKTYSAKTITEQGDVAGVNLDATIAGAMYSDSAEFSNAVYGDTTISNRLHLSGSTDVKLRAGVEVRSTDSLQVSVNETKIEIDPATGLPVETINAQERGWNLNEWRFNGEPGVLTLRAADNLAIQGSISDGFVKPTFELDRNGNQVLDTDGNPIPIIVAMPGWQLDPSGSASWSYRLVGGADMGAANPLRVIANDTKGDVAVRFARTVSTVGDQPVALIRTGSGRIDIASGRDVVLDSVTVDIPDPSRVGDPVSADTNNVSAVLSATIYTAGLYMPLGGASFLAPKKQFINPIYTNGLTANNNNGIVASFAQGGGSISISAEHDVIGAVTRQLVNGWLFRRGRTTTDASGNTIFAGRESTERPTGPNSILKGYETRFNTGWWSRQDFFNQGVATFGGGDISVIAGGNVENLSLSVATSGQVLSDVQNRPTGLVERGGGDISLRAGGDILGGSYYVQKGTASLSAGGSVAAGDNVVPDDNLSQIKLRPVLALGDGRIDITAVRNVEIETIFNPTLVQQTLWNADAGATGSITGRQSPLSVFSTYGSDSGVVLTSLSGDVEFGNHAAALSTAAVPLAARSTNPPDSTFIVYPGSLRAVALSGDIKVENGFSLWPSPRGQLELLAQQSVKTAFARLANQQNILAAQPIVMLDVNPSVLPSIYAPLKSINDVTPLLNQTGNSDGLAYHTNGGLHSGDVQPVRIVALSGDIVGESYFGGSNLHETLISPKAVEIIAGRDIRDFGFKIQHLNEDDVTTINAGRDFIDTTYSDLSPVRHNLTGPGRLDISAGRDIDLGTSNGIVTRGNLDNPYLPDGGASINLVAGATPDYAGFVSLHLKAQDISAADQAELVAFMRTLDPSLPAGLTPTEALALFKALPDADRVGFLNANKTALNDIFFQKLRVASGAVEGSVLDLVAFDALIASLYPTAGISGGDINVFGSQLKTARGGSVNIFAPGGSVQAGLTEKPAWVKAKGTSFESNLGVYTIAGGNLQSLVKKDFLVNQGRVFTLGGGDITLVSQYGDIDAGKGAKTSQSTPPPVIKTDALGNTVVDISSSISGSGIATLRTGPNVPASSVYPIAPRGIFDAGDAGVRSTGSVNIVAQTVLNANNIAAAGSVSGAQTATSGLSGTVSAPSNAPVTKSDNIASNANADNRSSGTLTVELLGYGGGLDGQQNVTEDSQNAAAADSDEEKEKKKKKSAQSPPST